MDSPVGTVAPPPPLSKPLGGAMPAITTLSSSETIDLTIPLIQQGAAIIRVPRHLTEENFALLTLLLTSMKPAIVAPHFEQLKPSV